MPPNRNKGMRVSSFTALLQNAVADATLSLQMPAASDLDA
jgi:hypothetical protein